MPMYYIYPRCKKSHQTISTNFRVAERQRKRWSGSNDAGYCRDRLNVVSAVNELRINVHVCTALQYAAVVIAAVVFTRVNSQFVDRMHHTAPDTGLRTFHIIIIVIVVLVTTHCSSSNNSGMAARTRECNIRAKLNQLVTRLYSRCCRCGVPG